MIIRFILLIASTDDYVREVVMFCQKYVNNV